MPPRDAPLTSPASDRDSKGNLAVGQLGMLAGQVLEGERRVANAKIRVIELDREKPRPPFFVRTDDNGWFDIGGLQKGQRYQLTASITRGGVLYSGQVIVTASDVRIAIPLSEVRGDAPAMDSVSGDRPAASLGTPTKTEPLSPNNPIVIDPTRTAEGKTNGWDNPPRPPTLTVPGGPGRDPADNPTRPPLPVPPGMESSDEGGVTRPLDDKAKGLPEQEDEQAPPMSYSSQVHRETPHVQVVPACVLRGNTVAELALYDREGRVWEWTQQSRGKLILLEFWKTDCPPCRAALPQLSAWQAKYGEAGFQVVSVLCEGGSLASRRERLQRVEGRQPFSYPVLFSEPTECPVRLHLNVRRYPTLILLDDTGRIVWTREGYDPTIANELEKMITRLIDARR
ncbi:MAG: TlpA disulfide reductase family protein [Gemmataceae bacterium]